jgi:hypothetical protein
VTEIEAKHLLEKAIEELDEGHWEHARNIIKGALREFAYLKTNKSSESKIFPYKKKVKV